MKSIKLLFFGLALLLSACAGGPDGPPFATVAMPPIAPGQARIFFYRDLVISESLARPWIYLNGIRTVMSEPGGVSYRDVPPGTYHITVDSEGIYPNQFKTIVLPPGQTLYVKIQSLASWDEGWNWQHDTFVVALISPAQAQAELSAMRYVSGV